MKNGKIVAKRFELYHRGVELANGYLESPNAIELKKRFEETNHKRSLVGKTPYPIDESFLAALANLPPCCGVSVGFDRLFMLSQNLPTISLATI
jgi:lysyl-tRNA synthetase class 2